MESIKQLLKINMSEDENQHNNNNNQQNGDTMALIHRVGVKIPPFWEESPDIWFAQIEAQFANTQINTDQTKFNAVVGAIESKVLAQVADAVLRPPAGDKYNNLKEKIIEVFSESEHKKMTRLLETITLGDQKPSMMLNEMRRLATPNMTDDFLRTLWLKRLPTQARMVLSTNNTTLPELAKIADKIVEIGNLNGVNAIATDNTANDPLQKCIQQLTKAVQNLELNQGQRKFRSRSQSRGRQQQSPSSPRKGKWNKTLDHCWYHFRFGAKADNCNGSPATPCKFQKN